MSDMVYHMISGGPRPVAPFSHAVESDGWVFVTGQMPTDPAEPDAPLPAGIEAQTRRVIDNLRIVLGGIGLSGGKGGIRNVIVGTLLIGVLLNGMTIMNIDYTIQNLVKGVVLLLAIVADSVVNPRDEQTSQQGDM